MKIKRFRNIRPVAFCALGVFLGRGAQADTILDFNIIPPDQPVNMAPGVLQSFGDNAAASSDGVTVAGFGTPNIGLTWGVINGGANTRWDYYNDGTFWMAGQIQDSYAGKSHTLTFTPNSASAAVIVKSFNFFPYYDSKERFTYDVSVLDGTNVVSGPIHNTFQSDASKNHPVSINYTGAVSHTLELRIARVSSTLSAGEIEGDGYNIAVDDIAFAQLPETDLPAGPQVVSVTPADNQTFVPAVYYPYQASITNGVTALSASSIQLKLDGSPVSPAPTISSDGVLTNVSYVGTNLLTSGSHTYRLTYDDTAGSSYANEVRFSTVYPTLPTAYGLPAGSGTTPGFTYRTASASSRATNLTSTISRAKAQLNGTLINPETSQPYTNSAALGTNADGSFNIDTVLNFSDGGTSAGNFPDDQPFPGLDAGPYDWFSTEALLYLELPAGYYRFGVNSDDGFEVNAVPPQGVSGSPIQLGIFDNGRAAADTLFDFLVVTSGVYGFQVIYFESTGAASCEFYSVTNLVTEDKVLINDLSNSDAIKSYRALNVVPIVPTLRITNIAQSGTNAVLEWVNGTPPFQVQFKTNLTDAVWSNSGSPTTNRTANVPIQTSTGFFRISGP